MPHGAWQPLVDALEQPAVVVGTSGDVLAANPAAQAIGLGAGVSGEAPGVKRAALPDGTALLTYPPQSQESAQDHIQHIASVFEAVPFPMFAKDREGVFRFVNQATADVYGVPQEALIGRRQVEFHEGDPDVDSWTEDDRKVIATGERIHRTAEPFHVAGGEQKWFEDYKVRIILPSGEPLVLALTADVTDVVRAREETAAHEEQYRTLIENLPIALYNTRLDETGDVVSHYSSPQLGTLLDFHSIETAEDWLAYVVPADRTRVWDAWSRLKRAGTPLLVEYQAKTRAGKVVWIREQARVTSWSNGRPVEIMGFQADITAERENTDALAESEARYRALIEHLPLVVYTENLDRSHWWVSPQFAQTFGEPAVETDPYHRIHPDDLERVRQSDDAEADEDLWHDEYRMVLPDGRVVWVHDEAVLLRDGEGRPRMWQGYMRDITAERRTAEDLRQTSERLEQIIASAPVAIVTLDPNGNVLTWNPAAERIFGWSEAEVVGKPYPAIPPELGAEGSFVVSELRGGRTVRSTEARRRRKDGSEALVSLFTAPFADSHGAYGGEVAIIEDITAGKVAEAARDWYSAVVEQSADALVLTDLDGRLVYANPAAEVLAGRERGELVGAQLRSFAGSAAPDDDQDMWSALSAGHSWSGVVSSERKDGTRYELSIVASPLRNSDGTVVNYLFNGRDSTREHELEEQVRHAQKMEAVGRLAGGVAHDFNNLLMAIGGYNELLIAQLEPTDARRDYALQVEKAAKQAGALTQQLLAFSRKQVLAPTILDINSIVADLERMLKRLIGEDIDLSTSVLDKPALLKADRSQVEQVLMNLVVNARDAMPAGGKISIEVTSEEFTRNGVGGLPAGDYIVLTVADDGIGMPPDVRKRIFEPFFTTKDAGHGTGLGLSTVYGIVSQVGGHIEVDSEEGKGSTFTIHLPRVAPAAHGDTSPVPEVIAGGDETILLVEDEGGVRSLVKASLEKYGYAVIEARSGPDALRQTASPRPIDLVITDVVMPRMTGRELAQRLVAVRPELPILYMSGYTDDEVVRRGILENDVEFIQKPFRPEILAHRVRQILDRKSA